MESWDVKRFLEVWLADALFREAFWTDPRAAVHGRRLDVEAEAVRPLVDGTIAGLATRPDDSGLHPAVAAYLRSVERAQCRRAELDGYLATTNGHHEKWRARQRARVARELLSCDAGRYVHQPYAIELSKGCSRGCRYCGFAAGKLTANARFADLGRLYREILHVLSRFFGSGAESGVLFWGTDPLDNPDFEEYLRAFHDEFGAAPALTTALWFRDIERTRSVLRLTNELNREQLLCRLSVNSPEELDLCLESFSARELEHTVVQYQGEGSLRPLWQNGRGRSVPGAVLGTNATASGFLVNLPERSVKLMSPTTEIDRWPLGYRVFAEGSFADASEFESFLSDCERRVMAFEPDDEFVPRLASYLRLEPERDGGATVRSAYREAHLPAGLASRLALALDGTRTTGNIIEHLSSLHAADAVRGTIQAWWRLGILEEPFATKPAASLGPWQIAG